MSSSSSSSSPTKGKKRSNDESHEKDKRAKTASTILFVAGAAFVYCFTMCWTLCTGWVLYLENVITPIYTYITSNTDTFSCRCNTITPLITCSVIKL